MKIKLLLLTVLHIGVSFCLHAQDAIVYSNVKVGDTLPDIEIKDVDNFRTNSIKLSELKQELLILDFWATWCGPCIAKIPRMDSIMKVAPNEVLFLSVTNEPKEIVKPFLERKEKDLNTKLILPHVYSDSVLAKLFPHYFVPHYVWIQLPERKVIAITKGDEITYDNIKGVISEEHRANALGLKVDKVLDYNISDPLLQYLMQNDSIRNNSFKQYSFFTNYIPNLSGGIFSTLDMPKFENEEYIRIVMKNVPMETLIPWIYGKGRRFFQDASKIIETKEPEKVSPYRSPIKYRNWKTTNTFCYEIQTHKTNKEIIFDLIKKDIEEFFVNYKFAIEEREMDCMVLMSIGSNERMRSKGGQAQLTPSPAIYNVKNVAIEDLIITLQFYHHLASPFIIIDKTGINFKIDLDIRPKNFKDFDEVNKELKKYNLRFVRKMEKTEVIVISDK